MKPSLRSGVIVYARDINKLSRFYIEMFGMVLQRETDEFISLSNGDLSVIIHRPPIELPEENFNTVKLFMTVDSHQVTKEKAVSLGGQAFEGEWANPIFKVCNIADPEGNHIQLREFI